MTPLNDEKPKTSPTFSIASFSEGGFSKATTHVCDLCCSTVYIQNGILFCKCHTQSCKYQIPGYWAKPDMNVYQLKRELDKRRENEL